MSESAKEFAEKVRNFVTVEEAGEVVSARDAAIEEAALRRAADVIDKIRSALDEHLEIRTIQRLHKA